MKTFFIALIMSVSLVGLSQSYQQHIPEEYGYKVKNGDTVPDFDIELPNGLKTPISALRGKAIMLQFTASWCSVCRKEMPHIESEIWEKQKSNPHFALYGIDLKEEKDKVLEFQEQMKITYPLALDLDGNIFYKFAAKDAGVTRNVIVDQSGKIVFMTRLYKEEEFNEMVKVIEKLLE
jgi:peroxiredoxin